MSNATHAVEQAGSVELGRVHGNWSVSPLREAATLLGVLKREGLAGSGLVNAFEKWAPRVIGASQADVNRLYREQTGRDLSDYILAQKADKIVRYKHLPPEAHMFRQIILKSRQSCEVIHDAVDHAKFTKRASGLRAMYKVRVEVRVDKGNRDGTVLLAARNGREAVGRARSKVAEFFGVPAKAVTAVGATDCPLEDFLVIDGYVIEKNWLGEMTQ